MFFSADVNAQVNCTGVPAYVASTVYDPATATNKAVYNNTLYTANWWTQNQQPDLNFGVATSGKSWTQNGTCSTGTTGTITTIPAWNTAGNLATASDFIGTTNYTPLTLKANNTAILNLHPSGTASVGVANYPGYYKFEVANGLTAFTGPNQDNQNNLLVLYSGRRTPRYTNGYRHYTGFSHGQFAGGTTEFGIINSYEYNATSGAGYGRHLLVQNTAEGNLGVGVFTTPPTEKLSVNGNTFTSGIFIGGSSDFILGITDGRNQGAKKANRALVHDGNDALFLNYGGDFEGGVVVDGPGLVAKQICVNTSLAWCDYVFDKDYHLKPLQEVESYIQANHHLEGIPAAKEVEAAGINLSDMVTLQMKKIEELTLYVIQQQKEIETLKKKIK